MSLYTLLRTVFLTLVSFALVRKGDTSIVGRCHVDPKIMGKNIGVVLLDVFLLTGILMVQNKNF